MPTLNTWAFLPNIAALRALGGLTLCDQAADVVNVVGYYTSVVTDTPDGGGGIFVYNASDTTGVDNGGTIIVDTVGRRWYRQFDGTKVNVKWFGAKGDSNGSTGTGTDDTAAVQAAIYYVDFGFGNGLQFPIAGTLLQLYFPAGIYRVTDTLVTSDHALGGGGANRGSINWIGDGKDNTFYHRSLLYFDHANTICVSVDPQSSLALYGSIKQLGFLTTQQATLQHCFSMVTGSNFLEGVWESLSFSGFTGSAIWFPNGSTAYMQQVRFDDISMSNIGSMFGYDSSFTFAFGVCNVCLIRNCNLDNSVNRTIATQPAFFDFLCFNEVQMEQIIYEGTGSTPSIIRYGGNQFFKLRGFHMEINAPVPDNFIKIEQCIAGNGMVVDIESVVGENVLNDKFIKFNGRTNTIVRVTDYASASGAPALSEICDFVGAGAGNHVEVNAFRTNVDPYVSTDEISRLSFNNLKVASANLDFNADYSVFPYIMERGIWIDGFQDGIASIVGTSSSHAPTNIGMFTDSDEGRCFEIVGVNNEFPLIIINVVPPAALVGQQMIFAIRFYLVSAQTPFAYTALNPNLTNTAIHPATDIVLNQWNTEVAYCLVPNTTPFTVTGATFDINIPSGIKKLRIAAIYVGAGTEVPVTLLGGGLSTKPIEWSAAAAPTYGDYIVGDKVTNSVPAVGQPLGWVCTVAGSPGTWVALANL